MMDPSYFTGYTDNDFRMTGVTMHLQDFKTKEYLNLGVMGSVG